MTDIPKAFQALEEALKEVENDTHVTVLFISDGQDSYHQTLQERLKILTGNQGKTVTFLCLGIQKQFPAFLSMYFREMYHNT